MMDNIFGKYRIAAPIGKESSRPACRARLITSTEWDYVVKAFCGPLSSQGKEVFCQYMEDLSLLKHASILPLIDYGVEKGRPFYVTKYMVKGSLRHQFEQKSLTYISVQEIFIIIEKIGQALQYAHNHHILHGNLKVENILISSDGTVSLADFSLPEGLSEVDDGFACQERLTYYPRFEAMSEKSDQYALACLADELFSQLLPSELSLFSSRHQNEDVLTSVLSPSAIELVGQIKTRLMKGMASDPNQRYENIAAFVEALDEVCDPFVAALFLPATVALPLAVKDPFHRSLIGGDFRQPSKLKQHSQSGRSSTRRFVLLVAALLLVGLLVPGFLWQFLLGKPQYNLITVAPPIEYVQANVTATATATILSNQAVGFPVGTTKPNASPTSTYIAPAPNVYEPPALKPIPTPTATPTPTLPFLVSLTSLFNNKGIGKEPGEANFDGSGYSYPASQLPSSSQIHIEGVPYQFPGYRAGANDNIIAFGQTIALAPGNYRLAHLLVSSSWGPVDGTVTIEYTDNSTSKQDVTVLDWFNGGTGDLNTADRYSSDGTNNHPVSIYVISVPLNTAKVVDALVFSSVQPESGARIHIFALTLLV